MELQSLETLERQITRLIEQTRGVKRERDELYERTSRLEAEVNELRGANEVLRQKVANASLNARDPEKEGRIKAKIDELLAKLEGL